MTAELFSDAMNEIGAKYVEEALYYERPKKRSFLPKPPNGQPQCCLPHRFFSPPSLPQAPMRGQA